MGYQTDFIGYLQIEPPLGPREHSFINRVSGSLFLQGVEGGLRVADQDDEVLRDLLAKAPQGWSNWTVCPQGCCLSYDGGDKANHMVPWLKFLMATFLVAGAAAEGISGMTCDHVLRGMVVGSRRDTRELYSITVRDNDVEVELHVARQSKVERLSAPRVSGRDRSLSELGERTVRVADRRAAGRNDEGPGLTTEAFARSRGRRLKRSPRSYCRSTARTRAGAGGARPAGSRRSA